MTSKEIKLIFHDLDGCLNPCENSPFETGNVGKLSVKQQNVLELFSKKVEESSIEHLVLNTGRSIGDTLFIAKHIKTKKLKYLLLEHSAYAWDVHTNKEVDLNKIAKSLNNLDYCKKSDSLIQIKKLIEWFKNEGQAIFFKETGLNLEPLDKKANLSIEIPKGLDAKTVLDKLKKFILKSFPKSNFLYCHSQAFIDILGHVHKSDGALLFCDYLEIPLEKVLIIGDGMNDMDIFEHFPKLLCPNNSYPELKELCLSKNGIASEYDYAQASLNYLDILAS